MASGVLEVTLFNAKKLKNNSFLVKMNPYALIRYGDEEFQSSIAKGQGSNPEWNEEFSFNLDHPKVQDHSYKLIIQIMNAHSVCLGKDTLIGETTIQVKDVVKLGAETGKADTQRLKYRVVLPDKTYYGEISVAVKFTTNA